MKRKLIILTALFLLVLGLVFSDTVSFKVGYFIPRAQSDLWEIELDQMTFNKSNFQNTNFCFAYEYFIAPQLSLVLGVDSFYKKKVGNYLDVVGIYRENLGTDTDFAFPGEYYQGDFAPSHLFSVSITPIQLSLKLTPMGRKNKFIPYVGGGVGVYLWNVRIQGDMIDFSAPEEFYDPNIDEFVFGYPIYPTDAREENKFKIGYHVFGGFMMPIANRISLEAEFKYNIIKGTFTEAFEGFEAFDLSGYHISIGMNYWF